MLDECYEKDHIICPTGSVLVVNNSHCRRPLLSTPSLYVLFVKYDPYDQIASLTSEPSQSLIASYSSTRRITNKAAPIGPTLTKRHPFL